MYLAFFLFFFVSLFGPSTLKADSNAQCQGVAVKKWNPPGDAKKLTIDSASLVPAGNGLPEYCQVLGHLDTEINFILNLPSTWNHKIEMAGNSGFGADLASLDLYSELANNYATVGTDTGHSGSPSDFLNRPDRISNYFYRSVHLTALTAKEIVKAYYGQSAQHAYFNGCSEGGTEGMREASSYPNDFDGIIAGAPKLPGHGGFREWIERADFPTGPSSGVIPYQKLPLLTQFVLQRCDAQDGLVDGIVSDPIKCNFSPLHDLPVCPGDSDNPNCFTKGQINVLEKIHESPSSFGTPIGVPFYYSGMEGYSYGDSFGIGVQVYDFAYQVSGFPGVAALYPDLFDVGEPTLDYYLEENNLRYIVFSNPNYLLQNFNFNSSDIQVYLSKMAPQIPSNADLRSFAGTGGKLLEYQGWGDTVFNPIVTKKFYDDGTQVVGGLNKMKSFDRLFLIPATGHCGGGAGPWAFDPIPVLENWVEKGQAPDSIVGYSPDSNSTRPICAYPQEAKLIAPSMDPTAASSFKCVTPDD